MVKRLQPPSVSKPTPRHVYHEAMNHLQKAPIMVTTHPLAWVQRCIWMSCCSLQSKDKIIWLNCLTFLMLYSGDCSRHSGRRIEQNTASFLNCIWAVCLYQRSQCTFDLIQKGMVDSFPVQSGSKRCHKCVQIAIMPMEWIFSGGYLSIS